MLCRLQTLGLVQTRADALGITVTVGDSHAATLDNTYAGILIQYPDTYGVVSS